LNTDQQLTWTIAQPPGAGKGSLNGFSPTPPQESATVSVTPPGPLTYEPDDGYSGSGGGYDDDSFKIRVEDSAGASRLLTVNVEISDKPSFDNGGSFSLTLDEDDGPQSIESQLAATDVDTGQTLTWSVVSGPGSSGSLNNFNATAWTNGGSVTPDTNPDLAYEPAADFNTGGARSESFEIQVADGTDGSDTITGNVTVNPVNDAPAFTVDNSNPSVNGDTNGASVADVVTGIGPGAADESGQSLNFTFNVTSNSSAIDTSSLSIDTKTGDLSVDTNAVGADTDVGIDVTLNDDGGTANGGTDQTTQSFTVTVKAVATTIDCTDTSVLSSASPGDECNNGDIYAGEPSNGKYLITTTDDEGGASATYSWNNGQNKDTPADSTSDGYSNTQSLIGSGSDNDGDDQGPHPAANQCWTKSENGHSDWYLPAKSELDTLYQNNSAIGNFDTSGSPPDGYYWSSTESFNLYAWGQGFSGGTQYSGNKNDTLAVRCVRSVKETAALGENFRGGICAQSGGCSGSGALIAAAWDEPTEMNDSTYQWNNNQNKDTPADSTSDGYSNTQSLIGSGSDDDGDDQGPHPPANQCWTKTTNSHSDWYLPAKSELDTLYTNLVDGSPEDDCPDGQTYGFDTGSSCSGGSYYWSSTDIGNNYAWSQRFSDGNQLDSNKFYTLAVRCVRRSN
jgi:hypothetical protein